MAITATKTKAGKHTRVLVQRASGKWEQYNLPACLQLEQMANTLQHSDLWQYVPAGSKVLTASGWVAGPCWGEYDREARRLGRIVMDRPDRDGT